MARFKVSKKLADKVMKTSGETSGFSMQPDPRYVVENYGKQGLKKIHARLKQLGYPFDYNKINSAIMYNQGYQVLMVLLAKELFNWSKQDIIKFGENNIKVSFLIKTLIRVFVSPKKAFKAGEKAWKENSSVGILKTYGPYMKKKFARATITDYHLHPDFVTFIMGFLKGFAVLSLGKKNVKIKQTKFEHKGDPCHEFVLTWD